MKIEQNRANLETIAGNRADAVRDERAAAAEKATEADRSADQVRVSTTGQLAAAAAAKANEASDIRPEAVERGRALLDDLRARGVTSDAAASLGDPFARGAVIDGAHDAVARAFGEDFARALDALPVGGWQGPIASPFGLHLVWVEERTPAHVPPFDQLRGRALHAYLREKGAERAKSRLAVLRCRASGGDACAG